MTDEDLRYATVASGFLTLLSVVATVWFAVTELPDLVSHAVGFGALTVTGVLTTVTMATCLKGRR